MSSVDNDVRWQRELREYGMNGSSAGSVCEGEDIMIVESVRLALVVSGMEVFRYSQTTGQKV